MASSDHAPSFSYPRPTVLIQDDHARGYADTDRTPRYGVPKGAGSDNHVLYPAGRMKKAGVQTNIAGTPSARQLIRVADVDGYYTTKMKDLDQVTGQLADDILIVSESFVCIHNDAGVGYAASIQALTHAPTSATIFGEEAVQMVAEITFPCQIIAEPVTHNPMTLKKKIDEAAPWDA